MRSFGFGFLALAMIWTSGSMALVRTAPEGRTIVICSGGSAALITLGSDGAPVEATPICPDCVIALQAVIAPLAGWERPLVLIPSAFQGWQKPVIRPAHGMAAAARDPPLAA